MSRVRRKAITLIALAAGSGALFQVVSGGCANFAVDGALTALDFCSIFNCTGAQFFDLCEPVAVLQDCPNIEEP